MRLLKLIGKVLIFPVILAVTVIQWLFTFLVGFSSIVFNLIAGLFFSGCCRVLHFRTDSGLGSAEDDSCRICNIYDPSHRTMDHRCCCHDPGRII